MTLFKKTKVVAIANQKGGVGKTTTSVNLGHLFSKSGKKTLYLDLDPQANGSMILSGGVQEFEEKTISDLFVPPRGESKTAEIKSLIRPVTQRVRNTRRAERVKFVEIENYSFVPSSLELSSVIEQSVSIIRRETILLNKLKQIEDGEYDYIILDCPPNLSMTTVNALLVCDFALIVLDRCNFSVTGMKRFLEAFSQIKELPIKDLPFGILENKFKASNTIINRKMEEWLSSVQSRVLNCRIRERSSVENSYAMMSLVMQYEPNCVIKNDYLYLAKSIHERLQNPNLLIGAA